MAAHFCRRRPNMKIIGLRFSDVMYPVEYPRFLESVHLTFAKAGLGPPQECRVTAARIAAGDLVVLASGPVALPYVEVADHVDDGHLTPTSHTAPSVSGSCSRMSNQCQFTNAAATLGYATPPSHNPYLQCLLRRECLP
jgi:hypothetical protein